MGVEKKLLLFLKMPLPPSQFDPIHTGRADPSRYLIIGFDTEYQRYADEEALAGDERSAQTQTRTVQKQSYYLKGCDG
jgi:hypothetical protein